MHEKFVWVDGRWQDPCWHIVFRMRLCGWIPYTLCKKAISEGLFESINCSEKSTVALTIRARRLTDIDTENSCSSHNVQMLANALSTKGFDAFWIQPSIEESAMFLRKEQVFPVSFRDRIVTEISSLNPTSEGI